MSTFTTPAREELPGAPTVHPLSTVLELLPGLPVMDGAVDLESVDKDRIQALNNHLDALIDVIHHGLGALGHLMTWASPGIDENDSVGETIAGLGLLIAELSDLASWATVMNAQCKYLNADFVSQGAA